MKGEGSILKRIVNPMDQLNVFTSKVTWVALGAGHTVFWADRRELKVSKARALG